jgi:hypothetical protein
MQYCKKIAFFEDRENDLVSIATNDDVGNNAFIREHYWKLMRKEYFKYNDKNLILLGAVVVG